MMKKIFAALAISSVLSVPAFAQSVSAYSVPQVVYGQNSSPLTRAQVRQELVDLESVGYHPLDDRYDYPNHIQAAEKKLWEKRQEQARPVYPQ